MTFDELKKLVAESRGRVESLRLYLKVDEKRQAREDIERQMLAAGFWDSREKAQEAVGKLSACKKVIDSFDRLRRECDDFNAYAELALESGDEGTLADAAPMWASFSENLARTELLSFLSGKFDRNNAFITIHAGAGGTESCDWASMLLRMYRRWIERREWSEELIDYQAGEEAGIKSVTLLVKGEFAYGYMKAERGVHRLVRISPFDSNARRHTSFASVDIIPELDDDIEIEVDEKELRVDTYRSSGAGGQHVNKTDSAIRLTHLPTGIVVSCQMERSQHKNRATAMKMLQAKLYALKEEERKKETSAATGEKAEIAWGSQIRSYVLHPYQLVKDLRTDVETSDTVRGLDGGLDRFVNAWLRSGSAAATP